MTNTPERTPAEELRAAAKLLRETAAKAMPGPWESLDDGDRVVAWKLGPGGFDDDFDYVIDEPVDHSGNAAWIALAHPGLAEPLAYLFEREADQVIPLVEVVAVARAINGGAS